MTAIAFPTLTRSAPLSVEWSLQSNTAAFTSPLTGSTQTTEFPGAKWAVTFTLGNLDEADASALQAFLVRLRGQAGRFTLHNHARQQPRGHGATGAPLVKGAYQSGTTLLTDGWDAGITGIMKAGDFFAVNGELKMVVADADSNGSGEVTLIFEPPLRAQPADNAALTLDKPTATFMLTEDAVRWATRAPLLTDVPIQAVECWT